MDTYDMLIIGFVDSAEFTNNETFLYGFEVFRSAGKPIIMTHDIVEDETRNSNINQDVRYYLRDITGQIRKYYNMAVIDDPSLLDNPYNPWAYEYTYDNYWLTGYSREYKGTKYGTEFNSSTVVKNYYEPSGDSQKHVHMSANQIMDNSIKAMLFYNRDKTYRRGFGVFSKTFYLDKIDRSIGGISTYDLYTNRGDLDWQEGWFETDTKTTNKIMPVNGGKITKYPFQIQTDNLGRITVTKTHAQDFQLDLEFDEDGDVLVWYDLVYGTDNSKPDVYGGRFMDSRNNYYIYTKGNITYSGVGHFKSGLLTEKALDRNEILLFINTMIAAYRSESSDPYITVTNTDAVTNGDTTQLYVDADAHNINDEISVTFRIDDDTTNTQIDRRYAFRVTKYIDGVPVYPSTYVDTAYKYPIQYNTDDFDSVMHTTYGEIDGHDVYYEIQLYVNDFKFGGFAQEPKLADTQKVHIQDMPLFDMR